MGLVIAAVVLIVIAAGAATVWYKVRNVSKQLFGTPDIVEGINRVREDVSETPKSVSGMTRLMEPQIKRDFPEFMWEQFKGMAERILASALVAISSNDVSLVERQASDELKEKVRSRIEMNEAADVREHYDNVHIYQTEISNYVKRDGKCIVSIQSAVGYYYYKTKGGKVISGDKEYMKQTKCNMELVYIQNPDIAGAGNAVGTTCPNCGAPITNLGAKRCEYCGSAVESINIKVWSLHNFYEVDYNHI